MTDTEFATAGVRPLLRGVLHEVGFAIAIVVGVLVVIGSDGVRRSVAAAAFAGSAVAMLGASALYHRVAWSTRVRPWMRRLDHAGIYALIAGTYTAVGLVSMHGTLRTVVLAFVWGGCAVATFLKLCWVEAPTWLSAVVAISLGWVGIVAVPQLLRAAGVAPVVLIAAGGIAYTLGGIVYARRKPDPLPAVFGYHELFHALTLVALALQYVAITFFVVRAA